MENLKGYDEQLRVYNIPDDIIKEISTAELVKTCLNYPEWRLINAYNDRRIGLSNVLGLFNGFHELFIRSDAAKELIKVYIKMNPLAVNRSWNPLQKGTYSFQFICIEMLLSHGAIIEKLDDTNARMLLDEAVSKYRKKQQIPDTYSLWSLSPTAGLCLNILDKDGTFVKNNLDVQSFQRTFLTEDIELLNKIIDASKK